jgi:hypothetical protein
MAGIPAKVVSERLGHASIAFTMDIYAHVTPGMQASAATTFADQVFGALVIDDGGDSGRVDTKADHDDPSSD